MPTPDYPTVQTRRIPPKVRSPPYPVICWQSGERPESTQLRHRLVWSENRTPATTASQTGFFRHQVSAIACANANAAHCPAERRNSAISKSVGVEAWSSRNHNSGAIHASTKSTVSSASAA